MAHQPNRLAHETSPYLKQHALNPVDWYPWGDEAMARARELDRPIFLSIGYSACHWCHVMEHESFENDDIAAYLNAHFVSIKVDREERPDLDTLYMSAVQMLTGHGGWPMSVFLTPDRKPFFGGTYWPPEDSRQMPGFRSVLRAVQDAWANRRAAVLSQSDEIADEIVKRVQIDPARAELHEALLRGAERDLLRASDRNNGGFGRAPKFPHPMDLRVLLRTWKRFGNPEALNALNLTLDRMANGGIYDHLGGGFHRYSTDARWLVPHFEKMLYDNALLVPVYLEAFQATGERRWLRVVRETLDYVLREMTQPEGGFYATQDADSEGVEGKFFVWSEAEVLELLGPDDGLVFCTCYDVSRHGNWEESSILNLPRPLETAARAMNRSIDDLTGLLDRCRATLFAARAKRIAPGRDDKVLVNWNGLMIAAMAFAGRVLDEPRYTDAARRAATFILSRMTESDGRLWHSFKDGQARFNGCLDDYACLIDGLVELFQSTADQNWLTAAIGLFDRLRTRFADSAPDGEGGFFYTSTDHEQLLARSKDSQDNATPSGNGMAAWALLRLGRACSRPDIEAEADRTLELLSGQMQQLAMASGQALLALDARLGPGREFVLVEGADADENRAARQLLFDLFQPGDLTVVVSSTTAQAVDLASPALTNSGPAGALLAGKSASGNRATLFVCRQGACAAPAVGLDAMRVTLKPA